MKIKVSNLKPHPLNNEIYDLSSIDDLVRSIDEVGLLQNLTIDQHNQVISGHRRLEAVKRLGWKKVQCDKIDVPKNQDDLFLVHYNKQRVKTCREILNEARVLFPQYEVGQGSRTDLTSVRPNKGQSTRDMIAQEIGVSSSQIGKLLFIEKEDGSLIELIDKGILTINQGYLQVSRLSKERQAKEKRISPSQTLDDELFTFHQKCSSSMDELENDEVDLIYTSPPYWNKREYVNGGGLGNEKTPEEYVDHLSNHLDDCHRVLSPVGSFFIVIGDTFHKGNLLNLPHRVVLNLQDRGWILRNTIIWSKTNPKPQSSKSNLTPTYEFIFHLVKGDGYKYDPTLIPLKDTTKPSHPPRHRDLGETTKPYKPYIPREGKNMGDWWSEEIVRSAVATHKSNGTGIEHPAPFPDQIVTLPILQTTNEGDLVVDPFMGTGTTGKVANEYGRRFVGYDIQSY